MLIVLDKDGTLLDMEQTWVQVAQLLLADLDPSHSGYAALCTAVGYADGKVNARKLLALHPKEIQDFPGLGAAIQEWFAKLDPERVPYVPVCPLRPFLERLRQEGHELAMLTNGTRRSTLAFLDQQACADLFAQVVCGDDGKGKKPDPEPLLQIAKRLGRSMAQTAMVGDDLSDAQCGLSAHCGLVVGVGAVQGAHVCVPDVTGLLDLAQLRKKVQERPRTLADIAGRAVPPAPPRPALFAAQPALVEQAGGSPREIVVPPAPPKPSMAMLAGARAPPAPPAPPRSGIDGSVIPRMLLADGRPVPPPPPRSAIGPCAQNGRPVPPAPPRPVLTL